MQRAFIQVVLLFSFLGLSTLGFAGAAAAPVQQADPSATARPFPVLATTLAPILSAPTPGQALQGIVSIVGSVELPGFQSFQLEFAYTSDQGRTWFPLAEGNALPVAGALAQWDTTTLTDEDFDLRLTVRLADGTALSSTVSGLRVRNYTPIEASTPTPTSAFGGASPTPQQTPTARISPTPTPTLTPLPTNPARLTEQDLAVSMGKGAILVLGTFVAIGAYFALKRWAN